MTIPEIETVWNKPIKEVENYTKEVELKDYFEENPDMPLGDIIDKVNEDIDSARNKSNKKYNH